MNVKTEWHYARGGTAHGPIDQSEFETLIKNHTIRPDTLVWREGMKDWVALETLDLPGPDAPPRPRLKEVQDATSIREGLSDAVTDGLSRFLDFQTRSSRPQFWFWFLFIVLLHFGAAIVLSVLGSSLLGWLFQLVSFALILPSAAVAVRRLHDIGRSGWWFLIYFIPLIGWIILLVWAILEGEETNNQWGHPPA